MENPMLPCRECGKDIQENWKVCPHCESPVAPSDKNTPSQSASVLVQDSAIGGDVNINQIESGSKKCPSCRAENVKILPCQEDGCATVFCELCHPECRWGPGYERFDSGLGSGPFCKRCISQKHKGKVLTEKIAEEERALAEKIAEEERALAEKIAEEERVRLETEYNQKRKRLKELDNLVEKKRLATKFEEYKLSLDEWESWKEEQRKFTRKESLHEDFFEPIFYVFSFISLCGVLWGNHLILTYDGIDNYWSCGFWILALFLYVGALIWFMKLDENYLSQFKPEPWSESNEEMTRKEKFIEDTKPKIDIDSEDDLSIKDIEALQHKLMAEIVELETALSLDPYEYKKWDEKEIVGTIIDFTEDEDIDVGTRVGIEVDGEEMFGTIIEFDDDLDTVIIEEEETGDEIEAPQDSMFLE